MVGVDFDLALGINLSAIDIFRYIDWSLILLLHVRRWLPFFLPLSLPLGYCWVHVSFVLLTWIRETWLIFVVVVLVSIRLVDRVLVCVRWLFWYLMLVLTIFSVRIVFWNVLFLVFHLVCLPFEFTFMCISFHRMGHIILSNPFIYSFWITFRLMASIFLFCSMSLSLPCFVLVRACVFRHHLHFRLDGLKTALLLNESPRRTYI